MLSCQSLKFGIFLEENVPLVNGTKIALSLILYTLLHSCIRSSEVEILQIVSCHARIAKGKLLSGALYEETFQI